MARVLRQRDSSENAQMPKTSERAVRYFFELYNACDVDGLDQIIAPDCVQHDPQAGELRGREAIRARMLAEHSALRDAQASIDELIAEGQRVAVRFTLRGAFVGRHPVLDVVGRGQPVEISGMFTAHVMDGAIVEIWEVVDRLGLLRQLGTLLALLAEQSSQSRAVG
jgi:predicted ester cyclase